MSVAGRLCDAPFWTRRDGATALIEIAADGTERSFSFADLDRISARIAARLVAAGAKPGHRIAIAGENAAEHLFAQLGVMRAGATATLMNVRLPAGVNAALLDLAETTSVIADAQNEALAGDRALLRFKDLTRETEKPPIKIEGDDCALIMFTSGSTGLPKAVPITHEGYCWALKLFLGLKETLAGAPGWVAAPLFHMNGQFHVLNMLSCGSPVVLMKAFDARASLAAIQRHGVVRVTGVPTMAALMAQEVERADTSLTMHVRQVGLGSAPLSLPLLARIKAAFPNAAVTNGYGATETGPGSFGAHADGLPTPPTALGALLPGVEAKLVGGENDNEGVLHLRNPMTLKAYLKRPEASAEKIDADGWYDTGDRMRRDENGFYFFLGRADDMLQVGGENVYPAQVERLLEQHPAVSEAVVVGAPHPLKGEAPVAFVTTKAAVSEDDLKAFALQRGPAYAHPRRIFFIEALPLASTNKIDRAALKAEANRRIGDAL
jgi:acyl-CoA synthetase (AMP-forming)/AMP-acid ligase II